MSDEAEILKKKPKKKRVFREIVFIYEQGEETTSATLSKKTRAKVKEESSQLESSWPSKGTDAPLTVALRGGIEFRDE